MNKTDLPWRVEITRTAQKDILGLQPKIRGQVEATIDRLEMTFNEGRRPQDMKQLRGHRHRYRIDTGEYRVLFYLHQADRTITVTNVRHRKYAYRGL